MVVNVGNVIAFCALVVSIFAAGWSAYRDSGRWQRLERYGNIVQASKPGSLEQATLQSVFDELALPLALEALAPPRKKLRRWAWVALDIGLTLGIAWGLMIWAGHRNWISWMLYGFSLAALVTGLLARRAWRELRLQWIREETTRRQEILASDTAHD